MEKTTYTINEAEATLIAERFFDAPREKVWRAFTIAEALEEWWAPKPWKAVTKSFDFSEGGHWHYYMAGPNGEKEWCMEHYLTIDPGVSYTARDEFSSETGEVNETLPMNNWLVEFKDEGGGTKVVVTTTYATPLDLQKVIDMGMKEGFAMALQNLEELLASEQ